MKKRSKTKETENEKDCRSLAPSFSDYTRKEIFTQGDLIEQFLKRYIVKGKIKLDYLKIKAEKIKRVYVVGDGTDYSCAVFAAYNFEALLDVISVAVCRGEFMCSNPVLDKYTLVVLMGEDGEAEKRCSDTGAKSVIITGFINDDSKKSISLEYKTVGKFPTAEHNLKLTALIILALYLAKKCKTVNSRDIKFAINMLFDLKNKIKDVLCSEFILKQLADKTNFDKMIFTGENVGFAAALYASEIFNVSTSAFTASMPYSLLASGSYDKNSVTVISSKKNNFEKFKNKKAFSMGVFPYPKASGEDFPTAYFKEIIFYKGTISMLDPILQGVVMQILAYSRYIEEASA